MDRLFSGAQELDRNFGIQGHVESQPHGTHPAFTQQFYKPILVANDFAGTVGVRERDEIVVIQRRRPFG